ncbi:DUF481 domain-containing protein [Acanthopleuribacter pedis]|uniref:DUF481 domain-containing protein n=1 Tax=Acanthopleuribacter pedis TaxID=442870 RepID=A0A8J7QBI1_9BACT|nr:DUF481 domain-containing protein [Acanthopleuribacter pedis]MBO1320644.1 DUF481 domain-containing protein [Acanthopleuribacter pedis]
MKQQVLLLLLLSCSAGLFAQEKEAEKKEKYWKDNLDLSLVFSEGNTISNTFSLKNKLSYEKDKHKFVFGVLTIHKDITSETETAVQQDDGSIDFTKVSDTVTIEEKYGARVGYERLLKKHWFFQANADWYRDRFSGVNSRVSAHAGIGRYLVKTDKRVFKIGVAAGYTMEDLTVEGNEKDDFFSPVVNYEWTIKINPKAAFEQKLEMIGNGSDSNDLRGLLDTNLANKFNDHIALKAGLFLLWDNEPALVDVALTNTAGETLDPISVESDKLDSVFTMSLSIFF